MTHKDLQAVPLKTEYNHATKIGRVTLDGIGCTDMTGAIAFFRRIDGDVKRIETFNQDGLDVVYARLENGDWLAVDHHRARRTAGSAFNER